MRILSVGLGLGRGGTERALQNFSVSYRRLGHDVAVLALLDGGPRREYLEREGIPVMVGGTQLEHAVAAAEDFAPDLIHIHRVGIAHATETAVLRRLRTAGRRVLETNVFGRVDESGGADFVDVHMHLSAWCLWRWRRWLGQAGRNRIGVVVPYPVMPDSFSRATPAEISAVRAGWQVPPDAFVVGRVGQPSPAKWDPSTLKAFERVAQLDAEARLVVLGIPDTFRPLIAAFPAHIRSRIIELPLTDDDRKMAAVYSAFDCFLHAAPIGETFGYVLTEAMLCGCPVITASTPHDSNSQVEVVGHLAGGLVARSRKDLPAAAERFWRDRSIGARLRPHLRDHVLSRFDSDVVAATAVRIGELALGSADGTALRQRIEGSDLRHTVTDAEVFGLLADAVGRLSRREQVEMHLRHLVTVRRLVDARTGRTIRRLERSRPPASAG